MHEPTCIGIELHYLRKGGLITPEDEIWIKEMILLLNRTVHVWDTPETYWRGSMHRAQGEGVMKWLAAQWYPDAPEAAQWRAYAKLVWNDFWEFRDNPANDTGYYFGTIFPIVLGVELMERTPSGQTPKEFFTDPEMMKVWERLLYAVSPDGAIVPYGPNSGWHSLPGQWLWTLEHIARYTGDGRFRYAAHRIMNYTLYQEQPIRTHHILDGPNTTESIALAYLFADDAIKPVQPDAGSRVLYHKETLRVNGKQGAAAYLKALDPAPDKAHICCNLLVTNEVKPYKLIFRSGWNPGDLFMLVDLFPRHEPMNVSGIIGLTRYGVPLTQSPPSKALSDYQNMLYIEDLSGTATPVTNPNPNTVDAYYQEVTLPTFTDTALATHAVARVSDLTGFKMTHDREFFFIKNRFVVVRDISTFAETFLARLGPTWRTQRVSNAGAHWANTYLAAPMAVENVRLKSPAYDLLVYHAPKGGARLCVIQDGKPGANYAYAPIQERYAWQGMVEAGKPLHFTTVLLPHSPLIPSQELVKNIATLLDTPAQTVLRLRVEPKREEWIVLNHTGAIINIESLHTDAKQLYLDVADGKVARGMALDATFTKLGATELFRQAQRATWEKP
ncbi:MAG: hypothetical protein BWY76_01544 [bacterium ADurb.Bin429]|nr:MAG: hypothetical protein BWY76_01544 [bacterium ADurb.Bin429]